jgi:hypothetical protein
MIGNRRGIIEVSEEMIDNNPAEVINSFALIEFIPFYIDNYSKMDVRQFFGQSPHFEEVPIGSKIPKYNLVLTYEEENRVKKLIKAEVSKYAYGL